MKEEEVRIIFGGLFMQFLQEYLLEKTLLTCSCGVASNKLLAKVASELNKPGKVTILPEASLENVSSFISIDCIPGLKSKTGQKLMDTFNIHNMYQITQVNFRELEKVFGYDLAQKVTKNINIIIFLYSILYSILHKISSWGDGKDNEPVVSKEMNDKITLNMSEQCKILINIFLVSII
jgi:hypothetical protein